jgi:eukaryotic-like serine/threonine-protein kinase
VRPTRLFGLTVSLSSGTRLGPYEILSPLGAGGMGEVYRARDAKLGRDVAIKVVARSLAANAVALARFESEAKAVAALSHPNILGIYDFGKEGGVVFAAMELLDGENLRKRLNAAPGRPLPFRKALEYALQIVRGLAAAHLKGIAHRDLKPENVFIARDGTVKVLDFGLAKPAQQDAIETTRETDAAITAIDVNPLPETAFGTVGYMAPEQIRGGSGDHRSDIFSFGLVFYEMLFGQRAFARGTAVETMTSILNDDPRNAPADRKVPPAVESILHRCLEKNPEERFHFAHDLGLALGSGDPTVDSAAAGWHGKRHVALLVARRPIARVLHRKQAEENRSSQRCGRNVVRRRRCPRRHLEPRRRDPLLAGLCRWAVPRAGGRWSRHACHDPRQSSHGQQPPVA